MKDAEDEGVCNIMDQLYNLESLMQDTSREIHSYITSSDFDPERFDEIDKRLNVINHLKLKYGQTIDEILSYRDSKQYRIDELRNYDETNSYLRLTRVKLSVYRGFQRKYMN